MGAVTPLVSIIVIGLIPSFSWLVFYLREDFKHPEPKKLITLAFILGGLVTFAVLPVQIWLNKLLPNLGIEGYSLISFLVLGAVEEIFKFLAVYLFIHKLKAFDEPLDAMIYMITAALGFAAVENIAALYQAADGTIFNIAVLQSLILRFVGATLLHTLTSGLLGYYWSLAFVRGWGKFILVHARENLPILRGFFIATVLHAIFNYLIITTGPTTVPIVFVVFVAFFVLNDFEKLKKSDI